MTTDLAALNPSELAAEEIERALSVAYLYVAYLPDLKTWVAAGSHPTTQARAFAEVLNEKENRR